MPMTLFVFFLGTNMSKMPIRKVYHVDMRALLDVLFPPRETERIVRTITLEMLALKIDPQRKEDGVVALLPYRDPVVHAVIVENKYYGNTTAAALLSALLADYLLEHMSEETALERRGIKVVPLPLSGKRRRERGYNQVERIAEKTCRELGETAHLETSILLRTRHTAPQTRLSKEARRENLAGAFAASIPDPAYLYIVVDDVYTTGATLGEAIAELRRAGAAAQGIALAY